MRFFSLHKTFLAQKQGLTSPKSARFSEPVHLICSNIFSTSKSFALLHSEYDFHALKSFLFKFGWNPCSQNLFFRAKTRFHLPQKRAIFVGFFIEFSAPHRCLMSSLAPLESSFYTLSNGTKLDISSARGAIVQPFFFLENHEKSRKLRVFHRSSAQSAKNKTSRFQHRNASAHSAKNKTSRFQHRDA